MTELNARAGSLPALLAAALLACGCGGAKSYSIGGTIFGLGAYGAPGPNYTLLIDEGQPPLFAGNGPFTFAYRVPTGTAYAVTAVREFSLGPNQTCVVANGIGTVRAADVTDIAVTCVRGLWHPIQSMTRPRHSTPLTLLTSGRVLATGPSTSSEIYDETRGWTTGAPMANPHDGGPAVRLNTGSVLVVGGLNPNAAPPTATAAAELFYDGTGDGAWIAVGPMNEPRAWSTASLLPSGEVLVAGGHGPGLTSYGESLALASAEIYDPTAGTFTPTRSMEHQRMFHTATLLRSGKVLVVGGCTGTIDRCQPTDSAEIYDPDTGAWTSAGTSSPVFLHAATLLANGRVLVTGGCPSGSPAGCDSWAGTSSYDPVSNSWTSTAPMIVPRAGHVAKVLPLGRVLVAGGSALDSRNTEFFDASAGTWLLGPQMAADHGLGLLAASLDSSGWLIAGGMTASGDSAAAEIYWE